MKTCQSLLLIFLFLIVTACSEKNLEKNSEGAISLNIQHTIENIPFVKGQFLYTNKAGNMYMISDIQWFMSDIALTMTDGTIVRPDSSQKYMYIDTELPETWQIKFNHIPEGQYQAINFTFGLDEKHNTSFRFVNPPESYMFWPEYLGGGYHYMKLNGKWIDTEGLEVPFNFHLGIGQVPVENRSTSTKYFHFGKVGEYAHCEGFTPPLALPDVLTFVQNYFSVSQNISFEVLPEMNTDIILEMQADQWFNATIVYNHNEWGGSVMQQQEVQEIARENGKSVFVFRR
jgi:hypothetical protein